MLRVRQRRVRGSSPLTRVAHAIQGEAVGVCGIIPAHAGSTPLPTPKRHSRRDHPRSRGEHEIPKTPQFRASGSSPLTRGARGGLSGGVRTGGIIPAHAGST